MKGIVFTKLGYTEKIEIQEVKKPVPKNKQVLIRVKASSLNFVDYGNFVDQSEIGRVAPLTRIMDTIVMPKIGKVAGMEVSGIVEEVGKGIKNFKKGDEVIAITAGYNGGWAEFACANENLVAIKPSNLSFEEGATMCVAGISAFGAVKNARIKKGQHVLVYGASGGVGQYAVQLSKMRGAKVTGVCSTRNMDVVRSIGADMVIDYKKEDFSKNGQTYDAILGINGYNPLNKYKNSLKPNGKYVAVGNMKQCMSGMMLGPLRSIGSNKKLGGSTYFLVNKKESLSCLIEGAEAGIIKPFIDKVYSVKDIKNAINYVVKDHPQGKVVITIDF